MTSSPYWAKKNTVIKNRTTINLEGYSSGTKSRSKNSKWRQLIYELDMSSDTLFYWLWTSHRTESLFFYYPFFSHPTWLAGVVRLAGSFHEIPAPFFHRCALAFPWSPWPLVGSLDLLCCWSVGAPFFLLFFHNSITGPPPFFSFLLSAMPHSSDWVTTSLHCVGSPSVAVLCESDCPSSACVVQLERKKRRGG